MNKYYYVDGGEKRGPTSLDAIAQAGIDESTLVWFDGLDDWKPAGGLPEMQTILRLQESPTQKRKKRVKGSKKNKFSNPFSFDGRIRRTEYGIALIAYAVVVNVISTFAIMKDLPVLLLAMIPFIWIQIAKGARRCHDLGKSGWWQLIPFYGLWLVFQDGQPGVNKYGNNPKG